MLSKWTFITCLSSFLFGYTLTSLNTSLKNGVENDPFDCFTGADKTCPKGSILRDIEMSFEYQELSQGALILGAWFGSLVAGYYSDKFGHRKVILFLNVFFILGAALSTIPLFPSLVLGRLILGLAVGCEAAVVPVLLSEIAPPASRGKIVGFHQLAITVGIAAAGGMGAFLIEVSHGWKWVQAFIAFPALLQGIFSRFVPESPLWLNRNKNYQKVSQKQNKPHSFDEMIGVNQIEFYETEMRSRNSTWAEVFSEKMILFKGVTLMALSALTGINSVMLYSTTIFSLAGLKESTSSTAIVAAVNVLATVAAQRLADTKGRRFLLLNGIGAMFLALVALSASLLVSSEDSALQAFLLVGSVLLFVIGFAIGFGAVGWTVISEIVPSRLRGKACGLFVSANWASNSLVSLFTLSLIGKFGGEKRGVAVLYLIFSVNCLVAYVFAFQFISETKGLSLGELHPSENFPQLPKATPKFGGASSPYSLVMEEVEMLPDSP